MWQREDLKIVPWLLLACVSLLGCEALNPRPPVEAFAAKLADEAIIPAVREGLAGGVKSLAIQAGAQGINPTYVMEFEGLWVTGLRGRATVGVEGLAGQVQIASVGPARTAEQTPAPTTQPTEITP